MLHIECLTKSRAKDSVQEMNQKKNRAWYAVCSPEDDSDDCYPYGECYPEDCNPNN